jgi:hypothetical protein
VDDPSNPSLHTCFVTLFKDFYYGFDEVVDKGKSFSQEKEKTTRLIFFFQKISMYGILDNPRFKCNLTSDAAEDIAKSLDFELSKYLLQ